MDKSLNDREFIKRLQKVREEEESELLWSEFYQRYKGLVYGLVARFSSGNPGIKIDDIVQDCLIQIFRKIKTFEWKSAFTSWLYRLVKNQTLMAIGFRSLPMKKPTNRFMSLDIIEKNPRLELSLSYNPEETYIQALDLKRALKGLAPGYKKTVVLHDIYEFEHEEIAELLGVASGTTKSQLHKARAKLRRVLRTRNPKVFLPLPKLSLSQN